MVDVTLRSYFLTPASKPKLTNPDEVREAIRGPKVGKTLAQMLYRTEPWSIFSSERYPSWSRSSTQFSSPITSLPCGRTLGWRLILKPVKDLALPSSYRPISLLDMIGKLFDKILLARILHEVSERGLMRDEQFGFRLLAAGRPSWKRNQELRRKEANRRSFPRRSQSLRYCLDQWPPLQVNAPKRPVLYSPYNLIVPPGSDVRSVLPDGHVISSWHAGWCSSGWVYLPCPLQSVCQWHALTLAPRRVSSLRRWHGHHSHVPQVDAARQLTWVIPQQPSKVVEWMENRQ